ncbi:unnamed protein product, partial [Owenia fusiformis]
NGKMAGGKIKSGSKTKKNKGKRWKKGQSSSSNPEIKKHRQAARNRFHNQNAGTSGLTKEALARHNEADPDNTDDVGMSEISDVQSVGGNTFQTWATNWTDCTNNTFSKVTRYWASNSAMHKEILAVLAAVTEVIKTKEGKETETEYFGALMTALEGVDSEESLVAITYLLSLCIKRVNATVLKKKFSDVAKVLLDILSKYSATDNPSLLRSTLLTLASLLRVQDQLVWQDASTTQIYRGLLTFTVHSKPKVRKAAHQAVCAILKGSVFMTQNDPPPSHPAASSTAKFAIQQLETSGGGADATTSLHILGLLKDVLSTFPHHSLKAVCEAILRLMTLSNVLTTSVSLQALHGMFSSRPKSTCLPADLNAQIIMALYDYQPKENDGQLMTAWLTVMEKAHCNLARLDEKLCISHVPRVVGVAMTTLLAGNPNVIQQATILIKVVIEQCLGPVATKLESILQASPASNGTATYKLFKVLEKGLSYQYHAVWAQVFEILQCFFKVLGKPCAPMLNKCLLSMADLRDSFQFAHTKALDKTFGLAVQSMGPRAVLQAVPLQITGDEDDYEFPRSWIIPVLRNYIENTELAYFVSYFLPLAAKLRSKSAELAKQNKMVEAKTYDALQQQIWSLLPSFCTRPTDIVKSFSSIAKVLGTALTDRQDINMDVMASIRKLILLNKHNDACAEEIGRFAKNFLPILFNMYTTNTEVEKDPKRMAARETIKVYLSVTKIELISTFFGKLYEKLNDQGSPSHKMHAIMDLAISMIPYVSIDNIEQIHEWVSENVSSKDKSVQKKCYRILEEISVSPSLSCQNHVSVNLNSFKDVLLKSLSSSNASSKAPRLRCVTHVFEKLHDKETEFLTAFVPEAILGTKEVAEKARQAAYSLLTEMCNANIRWGRDPHDSVAEFLQLLLAGLAGSPHMMACTTLAVAHIVHHFKDNMGAEVLGLLIDNMCVLLMSKAREVVEASLALSKVLLTTFTDVQLSPHLTKMVESVVKMKEDSKHHFRFKAKQIFTKLIKKFGFATIQKLVPDSHQKLLTNIRKTIERNKRQKNAEKIADEENDVVKPKTDSIDDLLRDTDSELEEEDDKAYRDKSKKIHKKELRERVEKSRAWLLEGSESEPMDFLDPSVSKKVVGSIPTVPRKEAKKEQFKMASDGRMIITEGKDEEEIPKLKRPKASKMDDIDELIAEMDGALSRKRKIDDDDSDTEKPSTKYKAGGSGIHRPLKTKVHTKPGEDYKAKKAGGDIKKKGKPDPFAYVPLEFTNLNRRKRAKSAGQFKSFVRGAKKGAAKGQKSHSKVKRK